MRNWLPGVSAHQRTVGTHGGVYFGTFFCMKASWPRWTRITDSGRSFSSGMIRSRTPSRYSTRSRLVASAPSNNGWSRLVSDTPSRDSSPLVALIAGILILIVPQLLNYIVAIYLIVVGIVGLNGIYHFFT